MKKHDPRGSGEGVPTDLRGKLTESQLRKSKNLAKRRLQKGHTKSKKRKRQNAEPCESDKFSEKATAESPYEKQKEEAKLGRTLRKRHFAECCESDKDGSKTAPIPLKNAEACGELGRAPARPAGRPRSPSRGSYTRRGPQRAAERLRAPEATTPKWGAARPRGARPRGRAG